MMADVPQTATVLSPNIASLSRVHGVSTHDPSLTTFTCRFSPDGKYLLYCGSSGVVHMVKPDQPTIPSGSFDPPASARSTSGVTVCARFSPTIGDAPTFAYTIACAVSTGAVSEWTVAPSSMIFECRSVVAEPGNETMTVDYSVDGARCASGGSDAFLRVYERGTDGALQLGQSWDTGLNQHGGLAVGHHQRITALKWWNATTFVSAGWGTSPLLYDIRAGHAAQRVFAGPTVQTSDGIDLLGDVLVTVSDRPKAQLQCFDLGTAKELRPPVDTQANLLACRVFGRPSRIGVWAAGRQPHAVYCYDLLTEQCVASAVGLPGNVCALDCSPLQPGTLAFGGADDSVFVADVTLSLGTSVNTS